MWVNGRESRLSKNSSRSDLRTPGSYNESCAAGLGESNSQLLAGVRGRSQMGDRSSPAHRAESGEVMRKKLNDAIEKLTNVLEYGHLLASMGGEDLLNSAADEITNLRSKLQAIREHFEKMSSATIETCVYHDEGEIITEWFEQAKKILEEQ